MRSRRIVRLAVLAGVVGLSLAVLIPVSQEALLKSGHLQGLVEPDLEKLRLDYTAPRSVGPGRIHFETLSLRIRDSNIELWARFEDVSIRVSLLALTRRCFQAEEVVARRLSFRLRERLSPEELPGTPVAHYPPITGFSDPPVRPASESRRSPSGRWRVLVDDLRVEQVREIWVDAWRFQGHARLTGGFELLPGREALVRPSRLTVDSGLLRRSGDRVVEGTHGFVAATLPRFDPKTYPGNDVWKILSGSAELGGALEGLALLSSSSRDGPRVSGGSGSVAARVALERGRGTVRLDVDAGKLAVVVGKRTFRGAARLRLRGSRVDFPAEVVGLDGTELMLSRVSVDGSERSEPWSSTLRADDATLALKTGRLAARIHGSFHDARPVVAMVPPGIGRKIAKLLKLDGLRVSGRVRVGRRQLDIASARGETGNVSLRADYRRRGSRERGAILVRKGILSFAVALEDGSASLRPFGASSWFERQAEPGGLRAPYKP